MERTADGDVAGPEGAVPSLVVVCGYPGVGKSRVARAIADRLSATVYRTDEVRAALYGEPTYDSAETERVYATLLERAVGTVEAGGRAVLDGTYRDESFRADVAAAGGRLGVDPVFVKVACPEPVARERITDRTDDASDAGVKEYYQVREEFDPLSRPHITVDNAGDWARTREQVCAAFPEG
jgi:predicted kinase